MCDFSVINILIYMFASHHATRHKNMYVNKSDSEKFSNGKPRHVIM